MRSEAQSSDEYEQDDEEVDEDDDEHDETYRYNRRDRSCSRPTKRHAHGQSSDYGRVAPVAIAQPSTAAPPALALAPLTLQSSAMMTPASTLSPSAQMIGTSLDFNIGEDPNASTSITLPYPNNKEAAPVLQRPNPVSVPLPSVYGPTLTACINNSKEPMNRVCKGEATIEDKKQLLGWVSELKRLLQQELAEATPTPTPSPTPPTLLTQPITLSTAVPGSFDMDMEVAATTATVPPITASAQSTPQPSTNTAAPNVNSAGANIPPAATAEPAIASAAAPAAAASAETAVNPAVNTVPVVAPHTEFISIEPLQQPKKTASGAATVDELLKPSQQPPNNAQHFAFGATADLPLLNNEMDPLDAYPFDIPFGMTGIGAGVVQPGGSATAAAPGSVPAQPSGYQPNLLQDYEL
jgi:hypothetical protein